MILYPEGFKPGDVCQVLYHPILEGEVTVVEWTPYTWEAEGCVGNYTFRPGLIPVFSPKFPATKFWWATPLELKVVRTGGDVRRMIYFCRLFLD